MFIQKDNTLKVSLLFVVRICSVIHLELRMDFRIGQDVSAGDAVLGRAVAPRVRVRVGVSDEEINISNILA